MAKYLATYSDTIDDIEITGFSVMTDKEMERLEDLAASITWTFIHDINGNEIEYSDGEDLLSRIDFREISNDEYKALNKVFEDGFGVVINEDTFLDIISENDDEEEFDEEDEEEDGYKSLDDDDDDY